MLEWMFVGTLGGLGAVVLMGLEALNCLLTCRGKRRTRLLYAAAGLGIVLLLWWGGDALLRLIGLSWRRWVQTAFGVAALVLGMAGAFLTVHCGAERRAGRLWHEAAVGIALLMLLACSVTIGPFLLAFSHTPERVLEVQGQTLVEEDKSFLDPHYVYYIGFGPLLRSRESVWSGDTPLDQGGRDMNSRILRIWNSRSNMDGNEFGQYSAGLSGMGTSCLGAEALDERTPERTWTLLLGERTVLRRSAVVSARVQCASCGDRRLACLDGYRRRGVRRVRLPVGHHSTGERGGSAAVPPGGRLK